MNYCTEFPLKVSENFRWIRLYTTVHYWSQYNLYYGTEKSNITVGVYYTAKKMFLDEVILSWTHTACGLSPDSMIHK
jgi:hypothetical protein